MTNSIYHFSGCHMSREYGIAWFRVRGYGLMIKAPWNEPLFSERYGYRKFVGLFGWRVGVLTPN